MAETAPRSMHLASFTVPAHGLDQWMLAHTWHSVVSRVIGSLTALAARAAKPWRVTATAGRSCVCAVITIT